MSDDLSSDLASLKIDRSRNPDARSPLRYVVVLVALLGVAALVYFVAVPYVGARVFKAEVEVTEIALVSPAQGQIELTSTGYVKPQTVSMVGPKVTGKVIAVGARQGQKVEVGQVLYELDVADQKAAIAEAQSRVAAARARAATARANLAEIKLQADRAAGLAERGVRPQATADDLAARVSALRSEVKAADAEVKAAQAQVRSLEVTTDGYTIAAPIAGTIINKPPEVGEMVAPGSAASGGSGTVEIADFSTLAVETDVPEGRLHLVTIGGPCEVMLDAFPGTRYRGKTLEIVPVVNRAKATVTVKVGFVDPVDNVLPEMSARVSFLGEELDSASLKEPPKLVVPDTALVERGGAKMVFVLDDGKVRMTPVELGEKHAGGGWVLVSGPPAGTRVVKNPDKALADGQSVDERTDG